MRVAGCLAAGIFYDDKVPVSSWSYFNFRTIKNSSMAGEKLRILNACTMQKLRYDSAEWSLSLL